jgi:hypothetical protein
VTDGWGIYTICRYTKYRMASKYTNNKISHSKVHFGEPGSSVSIVSAYGLPGDRGSIPGRRKGFFLQPLCPDRLWGPPSLVYNGYRGRFPGGKARPGRDADHSPPSTAEVVNE